MKTKLKGESRSLIGSFCDRLLWWFLDHVSGPHFFYFFFLFSFLSFFRFLTVSYIFVFSVRGERSKECDSIGPSRSSPSCSLVFSVTSESKKTPQTKTLSFLTASSLVAIVRRRIEIHDLRLLRRRVSRSCSRLLHHLFSNPLEKDRNPPQALVIYRIKLPGPAIIGERGLLHSPKTDLCQKVSSFELDDSLVHCVLPRFEVEDGAVQREEVRRECGKGFTSSKALCGHMACHFEREKRVSCSHFFQVKKSVKSSVISHGLVGWYKIPHTSSNVSTTMGINDH
ncbi:hypothetical protein YC2023_088925 [Brassica napus]